MKQKRQNLGGQAAAGNNNEDMQVESPATAGGAATKSSITQLSIEEAVSSLSTVPFD